VKTRILFFSFIVTGLAQTYPIAGTVVDGSNGSPMNRVRVTLAPYGRLNEQTALVTGSDGKFSFSVPKGKFVIQAEYRGYRQPYGQRGPGIGFNIALFTGPDQDMSNLIFRWFPPGAISGKIVDDRGEPVEGALVQLIRSDVVAGRKRNRTIAWEHSNDLGEYRFGNRAGGTYYLVVTGEPWYTARSQPVRLRGQEEDPGPGEPAQSYAPVYYPNSNDPNDAHAIELAPGAEVTADFRLAVVTGVKVLVHCPHPAGQSVLVSLRTEGVAGVESFQRQVWMFADDQTIPGVFPGHYLVTVEGRNGNTSAGRKEIDVSGADVKVDLVMQPAPKLQGRVIFRENAGKPKRSLLVRLIDDASGSARAATVDASGSFSFENVPPGRRRVQITSPDGFFATEIHVEGAPVTGGVIEIVPGADVHLTAVVGNDTGRLKGFVMDGDKPVAGVLAVLAPATSSDDPGEYRGFQTDSDGSFDYQNVRAGDYVLFAVDRVDLEYASSVAVRPFMTAGKPVRIIAHQTVTENAILTK
jgi:hypothetical protein